MSYLVVRFPIDDELDAKLRCVIAVPVFEIGIVGECCPSVGLFFHG